jgi:hypothetical protein
VLAIPAGNILGFIMPAILIDNKDETESWKKNFTKYLLVQNIIVTVLTIPLLIFARSKPPTPPS